jgi:hypothetical protein
MMNSEQQRIIEVANELLAYNCTGGSTSEQIAAAFILNDTQYLPVMYSNITQAWERLGSEWQHHVKTIQHNYSHLILR